MLKKRMVEFYLDVADRAAKLSRAKRLQVGAVIVKNDNIISFSWNGTPAGWDNNCESNYISYDERDADQAHSWDEERKAWLILKTRPEVVHAEMNALLKLSKSHESAQGATMFCTHAPCGECAKFIFTAGINKVYFRSHYRNDDGIGLLSKYGVDCEQYNE